MQLLNEFSAGEALLHFCDEQGQLQKFCKIASKERQDTGHLDVKEAQQWQKGC